MKKLSRSYFEIFLEKRQQYVGQQAHFLFPIMIP